MAQKEKGLRSEDRDPFQFSSESGRGCRISSLVQQAKQVGQLVVPTDREE
jgi:hypothetical protein